MSSIQCSFCGKYNESSEFFIIGIDASICEECIDLCNLLMIEKKFIKIHKDLENIDLELGISWR